MKNKLKVMILALSLTGSIMQAQKPAVVVSDKTGWHKITETTVNYEKESDQVAVMLADKFAALQFKITDAAVNLKDVDVYFEDGTMQSIPLGASLKKPGDTSKEIAISGAPEKSIARIILKYNTAAESKGKKGHVEIWGKKTNVDDKHEKSDNPMK